ncbi:antibiotic biosynthesis monooxygenase [Halococcus sp. IIIV-5B]|uniref:antibiotic biosynthesis monooxygenase n=1 Tax=Halococcus sp. IIIV-5B TaxID=2321230 RepID=UPI000E75B8C5|nr:antibiotic biosynthesis monooxygenase [Halococcus sp. IIIV-5B]RJT07054.1 hypothetical protein D3261_03265 [Halococcus sp. IIIV-5B]
MTISTITRLSPSTGGEERLRELVEEQTRKTRREPGNVRFLVYRREDESGGLEILAEYRDAEALQAHRRASHTKEFTDAVEDTITEDALEITELMSISPVDTSADDVRAGDHVGVTVPNVEDATEFFADAFGAVPVYDVLPTDADPMEGEDPEQQLGLPEGAAVVHMRLLRIGDGPCVELFQVADTDQQPAPGIEDLGVTHLGLYVEDVGAVADRVEEANGELLSPPHPLAGVESGDGNEGVYCRTPWGMLVELLTYPDGIDYPDDTTVTRWQPSRDH